MPEATDERLAIGDHHCNLTTFHQKLPSGGCLLVVQIAFPHLFGITSSHFERGLFFSENGSIREATPGELIDFGG